MGGGRRAGDAPAPVNATGPEGASRPEPARPDETAAERDDRNLIELLQELRVAGLGVQVLFGFLLALPFSTRFVQLHLWQRGLYTGILVASAGATPLQLGACPYHRRMFRPHPEEHPRRAADPT